MTHSSLTRHAVRIDGALGTGHGASRRTHHDSEPPGIMVRVFTLIDARPGHPAVDHPREETPQGRAGMLDLAWDEAIPPLRIAVLGVGASATESLAMLEPPCSTGTLDLLSMAEARRTVAASNLVILVAAWCEARSMGQATHLAQWAAAHDICTLALGPVPDATARHQHRQAQAGLEQLRACARCRLTLPPMPGHPLGDRRAGQVIEGLIDFLRPGLVCVDLADLTCVFAGQGEVRVGVGQATGPERALAAAQRALAHTTCTPEALARVQAALVTIRGSLDMDLKELHIATDAVLTALPTDAAWLFAGCHDAGLHDAVRVTLVAMGA